MHTFLKTGILASLMLAMLISCGAGKNDLNGKKAALEALKKEKDALDAKMETLEKEILQLDPEAAREAKTKLVAVQPIVAGNFTHSIDLQGTLNAEDISYVTPRGNPGQVKQLFVKQGDYVKKGQLLLTMDDAIATQQKASLQTQLDFAKDVYQRQQNLWKQNIGSEIQVLTEKNRVESMERQMASLQEQLDMTKVYASVAGIADEVTIRVGETFTGNPMAGYIKIVNNSRLKVVTTVPENYVARVKKGTPVVVVFPDLKKEIKATVTRISQSITATAGGFVAEVSIPADPALKANMMAITKIQDYKASDAITIPLNTMQIDEKGKYVLIAETENGKMYARKKHIVQGEVYGDVIEVLSGLSVGDNVITEGFQNLYDGQLITTSAQ